VARPATVSYLLMARCRWTKTQCLNTVFIHLGCPRIYSGEDVTEYILV
jgi:hypothetical protein